MEFFISGEISSLQKKDLIPEKFSRARSIVQNRLNEMLCERYYGAGIDLFFLAPMILQDDIDFFNQKKERKLIKHKEKTADFRLRIDYVKFNSSDDATREKLLLKNIIDATRIIKRRLKKKFNGDELEKDILSIWNITYSELELL